MKFEECSDLPDSRAAVPSSSRRRAPQPRGIQDEPPTPFTCRKAQFAKELKSGMVGSYFPRTSTREKPGGKYGDQTNHAGRSQAGARIERRGPLSLRSDLARELITGPLPR